MAGFPPKVGGGAINTPQAAAGGAKNDRASAALKWGALLPGFS